MLTIPQVQQLIEEAALSDDTQVKALAAVAGAIMLAYMQMTLMGS